MLDKNTFHDANVVKLAAQFVPLKLDAEKEGKELAAKYKVDGYPTVIFVDAKGDVLGKIVGYLPPASFQDETKKILDSSKYLASSQAALKKNPSDPIANGRLAAIYAVRGDLDKANGYLKAAEANKAPQSILADAYNWIGDLYQTSQQIDQAIELFRKADRSGSSANQRAYAKISIMVCYASKNDMKSAKKAAQDVLNFAGSSEDYKQMARDLLKSGG